jgi:DNA helicase IV
MMGILNGLLSLIYPEGYGTRSTTQLGVKVRSRAEKRIAEYFEQNGIRYEYEPMVESGIWIFTQKISRPDFYLTDYDIYVEYWGMVDVKNDRKRAQYIRAMKYKMARYRGLGIKFISIYPGNMKNLDQIFRTKFKKVTGSDIFIKSA